MMGKRKGIGLVSGGLDSVLAVAVLRTQAIDLLGLHFFVGFSPGMLRSAVLAAGPVEQFLQAKRLELSAGLGIPVEVVDISREFLDVLVEPRHGYGANVNPCIDCRILMLRKARERMERDGADFVFTGEVLGQRPMSQRRSTMDIVERESGLPGRLLRPLSAKLLPATIPEQEGLIARDGLLDIQGRSRRRQMELARGLGIDGYAQPAGGCTLTDENYARKFKDLLEHKCSRSLSMDEAVLLSVGRHFRLTAGVKVVVGRNEVENEYIERHWRDFWLLCPAGVPGPTAVIIGEPDDEQLETTAAITARYSDGKHQGHVSIVARRAALERAFDVVPAAVEDVDRYRI